MESHKILSWKGPVGIKSNCLLFTALPKTKPYDWVSSRWSLNSDTLGAQTSSLGSLLHWLPLSEEHFSNVQSKLPLMQLHTLFYNCTVGDSFKGYADLLVIGLSHHRRQPGWFFGNFSSMLAVSNHILVICMPRNGFQQICWITFLGTDVRLTRP